MKTEKKKIQINKYIKKKDVSVCLDKLLKSI